MARRARFSARRRRPPPTKARGREDRGASHYPAGRPPSAAILDTAFRRAYKASPHGASRADRHQRRALLKIVRSGATVIRLLRGVTAELRRAPLSPFEERLVAQRFGSGSVHLSTLRLHRAEERIRGLSRDAQRSLADARDEEAFAAEVRRFYGRLASFVREVDPDLQRLADLQRFRRDRPRLDPNVPVLAVAGFPNVGKSSLVAQLSSGRPKVAEYPFTTLHIEVGHADVGLDRLQVLDTPGVLDRRRRNPAEREAEMAVGVAASAVLFVFDPTAGSGHTVEEQERLLARWRVEFPSLPVLEVETKSDLGPGTGRRLAVSSRTGEGLPELRARVEALLRSAVRPVVMPAPSDSADEIVLHDAPPAPAERRRSATARDPI